MWIVTGALLGLVAGSFLAALAVRWPQGRTLGGRSCCDACGKVLGPVQLVPILSFLWQRGRCTSCGAPIDPIHPAMEMSACLIGALVMWIYPVPAGLLLAVAGFLLLALMALDAAHHWLPDRLVVPLLILGLVAGRPPLADRVIGAAVGAAVFTALLYLYRWRRGRDGLGWGDIKLVAALGAWLGWRDLPPLVLLAALLGLLIAAMERSQGKTVDRHTALPLGTCLAISALPFLLL